MKQGDALKQGFNGVKIKTMTQIKKEASAEANILSSGIPTQVTVGNKFFDEYNKSVGRKLSLLRALTNGGVVKTDRKKFWTEYLRKIGVK